MKKLLSILLSIAICFSLTTPAFASAKSYEGNGTIPTVEVNEVNGVRTAISSDDHAEYTISFNRNTMSLCIVVKELSTNAETSTTVHVNGIQQISLTSVPSSIYTSNLYAYERTRSSAGTEWYLQRPKMESEGTGSYYFKCWENNSNSSELELFRDAVQSLSEKESTLLGYAGGEAGALFLAGLLGLFASLGTAGLAAPGVAALIAAISLSGPSVEAANAVALQCNTCFEAIEDVYYATDNMHF